MINYSNKKKQTKKEKIKKRIIKPLIYVLIIALVLGIGNFALNKLAFRNYNMKSFMGANRYVTGNVVNKGHWKNADTAIIVNTNYLNDAVGAVPYAFDKKIPVYFTEKEVIEDVVIKDIKSRKIKNVIITGGITSISNRVERTLKRNGINSTRIIAKRGTGLSLKFASLLNERKKVPAVAVVANETMNTPNAVSFMPIASRERIPVIVFKEHERSQVLNFIREIGVNKVYVIGNTSSFTTSTINLLPNAEVISGKDRFEVNRNIIRKFFKPGQTDTVYVTKGGTSENEKELKVGEFINSLYSSNIAAKEGAPVMFSREDYLTVKESELIKDLKIKNIKQVGFKLKRRSIFNPERLRIASALSLMAISLFLVFRAIYARD